MKTLKQSRMWNDLQNFKTWKHDLEYILAIIIRRRKPDKNRIKYRKQNWYAGVKLYNIVYLAAVD